MKQRRTKRQMPPPPAKTPDNRSARTTGFFSNIAQGFAFGTGSSVAHRTIDSVVSDKSAPTDNSPVSTITANNSTSQPSDTNKLTDVECYELVNNYYECFVNYQESICANVGRQMLKCLEQASHK